MIQNQNSQPPNSDQPQGHDFRRSAELLSKDGRQYIMSPAMRAVRHGLRGALIDEEDNEGVEAAKGDEKAKFISLGALARKLGDWQSNELDTLLNPAQRPHLSTIDAEIQHEQTDRTSAWITGANESTYGAELPTTTNDLPEGESKEELDQLFESLLASVTQPVEREQRQERDFHIARLYTIQDGDREIQRAAEGGETFWRHVSAELRRVDSEPAMAQPKERSISPQSEPVTDANTMLEEYRKRRKALLANTVRERPRTPRLLAQPSRRYVIFPESLDISPEKINKRE